MAYTPSAIPHDTPPELAAWLAVQLRQIGYELQRSVRLIPTGVAPSRPEKGALVYAIDPWATTLGAEGVYVYNGTSWSAL